MRKAFLAAMILALAGTALAEVKTQDLEYKDGKVVLEGYLAWDDSVKEKRPGVLVVHEWSGLGEHAKGRARQLAKMGYVALAADIYGKGVRPRTVEDCQAEASKYWGNRKLLRARAKAGLKALKTNPAVDPKKLAAIGYCFGGLTVLEIARGGTDLAGVASFHGNLTTTDPKEARNIKCKVLVLHGADDPFVPKEVVEGFKKEMEDAKVDYKFVAYPGAQHSFTNPEAKGQMKGAKYNAKADKGSWKEMSAFLAGLFGK